MELNEQQKTAIRQWVEQGAGLAEIQKRLREEMGVSMTYMDVRFLALDMGLNIKERKKAEPKVKTEPDIHDPEANDQFGADAEEDDAVGAGPEPKGGRGGAVSVSVDRVVKPGSVVSGTVKFSDGVAGTWFLDRLGQLALQTKKPGYKPNGPDLQAFQGELRKALERSGF